MHPWLLKAIKLDQSIYEQLLDKLELVELAINNFAMKLVSSRVHKDFYFTRSNQI